MDIVADTEIQIAATTIDINGAVDISGATTQTGVLTTGSTIQLGHASDTTIARTAAGIVTIEDLQIALVKAWELSDGVTGVAISGSNKIYTITHGMGASRCYGVEIINNVADTDDGGETIHADVTRPSDTTIVVTFAVAPTENKYIALVTKFPEAQGDA